MTNRPTPTLEEKTVLITKPIMCKLDINGVLEFANEYFVELSGYTDGEIMGKNINFLYHPFMPKIITNTVWSKIINKQKVNAVIKFLCKNGDFYWLQVKLDYRIDPDSREIVNVYLYGTTPERSAIYPLDKFYKKIITLESEGDYEIASKFFDGYLESENLTYDEFIEAYLKI